MRAVVIQEHGTVEKLKLINVEMPEPSNSEEIKVKIAAVGINYRDTLVRKGVRRLEEFPHILGGEFSGWVVDSKNQKKRVIAYSNESCEQCESCKRHHENLCRHYKSRSGGYAEYIVVRRNNLFEIPEHLTMVEAAAIPINYLTAWNMLRTRGQSKPGDIVIITGSSGGVGTAAITLAKYLGLTVIAVTSNNQNKVKLCKDLGADYVISDFQTLQLSEQVRKISKNGVNIVIDTLGELYFDELLRSMDIDGKLVVCGSTTGTEVKMNLRNIYLKHLNILGGHLGSKKEFRELLDFIKINKIRPAVGQVFKLEEAGKAHQLIESRGHVGKVVLEVRKEN